MTHSSQEEIISRHSLLWLLIVNIAVLAPLYDKLTPWSLGICGICLVWRFGIFIGKVAKPPRYLVTALAIASAITLALVTSEIGLLNGLINLLILGYALKYIEMRNRRDVRTVVLVGYFLIAITFIDQQSIFYAVNLTFVTGINTCVLVSLYREDVKLKETARIGFKLLLQSLPLAALLFLVLPRLPPLWMVPQQKSTQTGLSDEVSFGDITELTRSAALAFRAEFSMSPPSNQQLYWRALVMEDYDGSRWTQNSSIKDIEDNTPFTTSRRQQPEGSPIQYSVIAEPSNQHWLFGLDAAFSSDIGIINLPDYRLYSARTVDQKFQYHVDSYPQYAMDKTLDPTVRLLNLRLPDDINPRTFELAQSFKKDLPDPTTRLRAMMRYFTEQPYFYTLTPPRVGPQQIDDFLFENKAGFCVHYASAFTFMARASGLPARLVTGYQGGEFNQSAGYLSIYQYMAHAWTEVWIENRGWVRYDPTAMIAPERVLEGFDAYFQAQESYLLDSPFSPLRLREFPLLNELRLTLASIDYYWSVWVLGFDSSKQEQILQKLLGEVTQQKIAIFMLVSITFIGLVIAYSAGLIHFHRDKDRVASTYLHMCHLLEKKGVIRDKQQGPTDFCSIVEDAFPGIATDFRRFTHYYVALKYQPLSSHRRKKTVKLFSNQFRKLRLKILKGKTS
ncbi:transglutaminase domain protein [Shewanella sediminis HAW-EB3]|uniref:Transglutaminase domain protein n=1 Tax=Shewanella sediminis (strain HAW-EB3) TaxID=425104 RepID=A8FUQ1_SHESH|nr:DUF3488 and transglutaminase-like domain-containing protein [Shewanella sediminis]ABV36574.1 transglutaminase domain protein [Shewanella sediminis HAW-EB3]